MRFPRLRIAMLTAKAVLILTAAVALGQAEPNNPQPPGNPLDFFPGLDTGSLDPFGVPAGQELVVTADYVVKQDSRQGAIRVTGQIAPGWHTYSLDQQDPIGATKIGVTSISGAKVTGSFFADHPPTAREVEYDNIPLQEHHGNVVWIAPIELDESTDPQQVKIELSFQGQVCHDQKGCIPIHLPKLEAAYGGTTDQLTVPGELRSPNAHAVITAWIEPNVATAGSQAVLKFQARIDPKWHIYAFAAKAEQVATSPTLFAIDLPEGWTAAEPVASKPPIEEQILPDQPPARYHEQEVTWTIDLGIPPQTKPGTYKVTGLIGYQTCSANSCDRQVSARFEAPLPVSTFAAPGRIPLQFSQIGNDYEQVKSHPALARWSVEGSKGATESGSVLDLQKIKSRAEKTASPWYVILPSALLAGLILNIMPCVLPVIGLKIMSFVQQAGDSRGRILMLNIWYSLGIIAVFMVLASLAASVNLGWGAQFSNATFNLVLVSIVFVFALSLLGVWEIHVPGFVGTGQASKLAMQEGPLGAFAKGALTTVLATPCSGPLLVPVVAWAVGVPVYLTYLTFLMLGVGMALPYLLVALFPKLIAFLPKPGAWMDTFKQAMGFVLMGTAVFLLSYITPAMLVPTLAFLAALGAGCWWIGRTSVTAKLDRKLAVWLQAVAFVALIGFISVRWIYPIMDGRFQRDVNTALTELSREIPGQGTRNVANKNPNELPWQPYSRQLLEQLTAQGQTVLVDFTADWCLVCKRNEAQALNVADTKQVIEANGVATLKADKTRPAPEVDELLTALGNTGTAIPFYAIFPADDPNQPILLDGWLSSSSVIDALKQAGPSKNAISQDSPDANPQAAAAGNPRRLPWQPYSAAAESSHQRWANRGGVLHGRLGFDQQGD